MAALYSGFALVPRQPLADAAILLAIIFVVNWLWLLLGAMLTQSFRRPVIGRALNIAFAVILVASIGIALAP